MIRVHIVQDPVRSGYDITFVDAQGEKLLIAEPVHLTFVPIEAGRVHAPTLSLSTGTLQSLVDGLSGHGMRRDSELRLAGEMTAVRDHLEDLRSLLQLPTRRPA